VFDFESAFQGFSMGDKVVVASPGARFVNWTGDSGEADRAELERMHTMMLPNFKDEPAVEIQPSAVREQLSAAMMNFYPKPDFKCALERAPELSLRLGKSLWKHRALAMWSVYLGLEGGAEDET